MTKPSAPRVQTRPELSESVRDRQKTLRNAWPTDTDPPRAWVELVDGTWRQAELTYRGNRCGYHAWYAHVPGRLPSRQVTDWIAVNMLRPYLITWKWNEA